MLNIIHTRDTQTDKPIFKYKFLGAMNIAYILKVTPKFQLHFICLLDKILKLKFFCLIANMKVKCFPTFRKFIKYNHQTSSVYSMVYLFVGSGDLCLQFGLSVFWFGVMFVSGFVG